MIGLAVITENKMTSRKIKNLSLIEKSDRDKYQIPQRNKMIAGKINGKRQRTKNVMDIVINMKLTYLFLINFFWSTFINNRTPINKKVIAV